jgi:UDP-N-acetylmuramate dehydrogenase
LRSSQMAKSRPDLFRSVNLSEHTTWRIGGPCIAARADSVQRLREIVTMLKQENIPWTILGKGSNTLAPSSGWNGVAVMLRGEFTAYRIEGMEIRAGAGAPLPSMAGAACSAGVDGFTFAVGIPGTIGGAVCMNAGAYGGSMSQLITSVSCLNDELIQVEVTGERCGFGYRTSVFQDKGAIVTSVTMRGIGMSDPALLRRSAVDVLRLRRTSFPLHSPNAGSVFKRPDNGPPPGKLIEDCGLKGYRIGGARVSPVHANFMENTGGATSLDMLNLMDHVRSRVLSAFGIELKREIRVIGEDH